MPDLVLLWLVMLVRTRATSEDGSQVRDDPENLRIYSPTVLRAIQQLLAILRLVSLQSNFNRRTSLILRMVKIFVGIAPPRLHMRY